MTASEFYRSKYYKAICSAHFRLTEWITFTDENGEPSGYLKTYTYKEACANWWNNMNEVNRKIFMSMPNFDKDIFFEITGVKV